MERNVKLLRQVYRQVKDNPETHDQRIWIKKAPGVSCGTTGCVAGWGVLLGDPEAVPEWYSSRWHGGELSEYVLPPGKANRVGVGVYAAELFGLSTDERDWLFSEDRTRAEVLGGLADLVRGESTEYMEPEYDPEDYDWSDAEFDDIDTDWTVPGEVSLPDGVTVHTELMAELEEPEDPYGPSLDADWGLADVEFQPLHA